MLKYGSVGKKIIIFINFQGLRILSGFATITDQSDLQICALFRLFRWRAIKKLFNRHGTVKLCADIINIQIFNENNRIWIHKLSECVAQLFYKTVRDKPVQRKWKLKSPKISFVSRSTGRDEIAKPIYSRYPVQARGQDWIC